MNNLRVVGDKHPSVPDLAFGSGGAALPCEGQTTKNLPSTAPAIPEGHTGRALTADRISVISIQGKPLMPCKWRKAKKLVKGGIATFRTSKLGIRYLQMHVPVGEKVQEIALGLDSGSKYSGIAIASKEQVHLQLMLELPTRIKEKIAERKKLRGARRYRINSYRQHRFLNRTSKALPPSIRARKQLELRVTRELAKLYPISHISFEDIKFNHYRKRTGSQFSIIEIGKNWLCQELGKIAILTKFHGYETKAERERIGLKKISSKNMRRPEAHTTDAIALCNLILNSIRKLTSKFLVVKRAPISRRQLHLQNPAKGGQRRRYGGTWTPVGKKGSLVRYKDILGYISGYTGNLLSISDFDWKRVGRFPINNCVLQYQYPGILVKEMKSHSSAA